jgi:hypothetical protein
LIDKVIRKKRVDIAAGVLIERMNVESVGVRGYLKNKKYIICIPFYFNYILAAQSAKV